MNISSDLTKYVYKENEDSNVFFIDIEDYTGNSSHLQGYCEGDTVKWVWERIKYIGTLRNWGSMNSGIFIITDAEKLT